MAIPVTFAGQTYSIPQRGDTGWFALTDYLVALSQAQTRTQTTFNLRSVSASTSVTSTDTFIAADTSGGNITVTFPAAALNNGRLLGVIITAGTNQAILTPDGSDTISGATSYSWSVVGTAAYFVAVGSNWQLLASVGTPVPQLSGAIADATNGTVASSFAAPLFTATTSVGNLQSCAITFASARQCYELWINASSTQPVLARCSFGSSVVTAAYDPAGLFLPTQSGTGIAVTKSSNNATLTVQNRLGTSASFQITATLALITSVTAWS